MKTFVVVALNRGSFTESVVALVGTEVEAVRQARRIAAAIAGEFVRCRVQPMDLTVEQVKAICYRWGREDAAKGEPADNHLPGVYGAEYRRGHGSVRPPSDSRQSA